MPEIIPALVFGIIALGILVIVHEFGHFLMAKLTGVKVLTFSVGFGYKLLKFRKGETEYAISIVPLGGYVKMLGESPDDEVNDNEAHRSFTNKSPWVRILIAFVGPFFNVLFALILFYVIAVGTGYSVHTARVGGIVDGMPAAASGIKAGDIIEKIDTSTISNFQDIALAVQKAPQGPVPVTVRRGTERLSFSLVPVEKEQKDIFGSPVRMRVIGVERSDEVTKHRVGPVEAVSVAAGQTYELTKLTFVMLGKLVQGAISPKNIGGPVLIFKVAGERAKKGFGDFLFFMALISVNLAVLNILPIPILDGGHILINLIEIVIRRRIPQRVVDISQRVGLVLLVLLMVFAFYNDIDRMLNFSRFFGGK